MFTSKDILTQLDRCTEDSSFPMFDNGYIYPAGTKLTAYCSSQNWVIVIETIGFSYRGGGHNGISNCLHVFGNCLRYEPGMNNENFLSLTDDSKDCNTFDEEEYFYINPSCSSFLLRNETLPLIHDKDKYKSAGIILEDEKRINAFEFLRLLDDLFHDKLVATEAEIRERIPKDIPKIIELRDWFHPDTVNNELPSENETFQQIAKVLEFNNPDLYKPTHKPNTHWKNWPEGGTL